MRENIKKQQNPSAAPSIKSERTVTSAVADIEDIRSILYTRSPEHLASRPQVQTKLTVGAPDDKYEEEADRIADRVMRSSRPLNDGAPRKEGESRAISPALETRIRNAQEGGQPLPEEERSFMESRLETDLSAVKVHLGAEAGDLADSLNARAFTVGENIWFGRGESPADRRLLAHELTHALQQKKSWGMPLPEGVRMTTDAACLRRDISTPLEDYLKEVDKKKSAKFKVGDVPVEVKQDIKSKKLKDQTGGETRFKINWSLPKAQIDPKTGKVTKISPIPKAPKVTIQTLYGLKASPESESQYGRGTTKADIKAGKTTLRFHEGSHGEDYLQYLKSNPPPQFKGKVGMKMEDYFKAEEDYKKQMEKYRKDMKEFSEKRTDCVGIEADFCSE